MQCAARPAPEDLETLTHWKNIHEGQEKARRRPTTERRIRTEEYGFTIARHIATISDDGNGGTLELNEVIYTNKGDSYDKGDGYDLRRWDGDTPRKGCIKMNAEFLKMLYLMIARYREQCPDEIALMTSDSGKVFKMTRQEVKNLIETLIELIGILDEREQQESASIQPRRTRRTRRT